MTTPALNKGKGPEGENWYYFTENYALINAVKDAGYDVVNRETGQAEGFSEQFPSAVLSLLWLQDNWDNLMGDPAREYELRKSRMGAQAQAGSALVQSH